MRKKQTGKCTITFMKLHKKVFRQAKGFIHRIAKVGQTSDW